MSLEATSAIDADLAKVNAAALQLASAIGQEHTGPEVNPSAVQSAHAAVQAAEAALAQAEAALHAAQAASSAPAASTASTAPQAVSHSVTDPGGIVV